MKRRPVDPARVCTAALEWSGTPYQPQASVKGIGCDCLGLARGIWRDLNGPEPISPPPYSRDWGEIGARETFAQSIRPFMIEIDAADAGPGALILFRMHRAAPAKHCGVVLPQNRFIHAYERGGVMFTPFDRVWRRRAVFAFLYPQV